MMSISKFFLISVAVLLFSCFLKASDRPEKINPLIFEGESKPFSGLYKSKNGDMEVVSNYLNGFKEGIEKHFYNNGEIAIEIYLSLIHI